MVDLNRIEKVIADSGVKKEQVAVALGISLGSLYNKLQGKTDFTVTEANAFCEFFQIADIDRKPLFFADKVDTEANMERNA